MGAPDSDIPGCFESMGMVRSMNGGSEWDWECASCVGHQSAGSFGRNATQETHNGAYCTFRLDDSCLLAP